MRMAFPSGSISVIAAGPWRFGGGVPGQRHVARVERLLDLAHVGEGTQPLDPIGEAGSERQDVALEAAELELAGQGRVGERDDGEVEVVARPSDRVR